MTTLSDIWPNVIRLGQGRIGLALVSVWPNVISIALGQKSFGQTSLGEMTLRRWRISWELYVSDLELAEKFWKVLLHKILGKHFGRKVGEKHLDLLSTIALSNLSKPVVIAFCFFN